MMKPIRSRLTLLLAVSGLVWQAVSSAQTAQPESQTKPTAAPEIPAALVEVEPGKVEAAYEGGKLTIKARQAPFIDVLRKACELIGAELNAPEDATEPILRVIGPESPKSALTSLLRDSPFNYAIAESPDHPTAVASVTVFPKDKPASVTQQLTDLLAQIQAESADAAAEGDSANLINQTAQQTLKAMLADPAALAAAEAGDADPTEAQPIPHAPPDAPPNPAGRHGRR